MTKKWFKRSLNFKIGLIFPSGSAVRKKESQYAYSGFEQ